MLHTEYKTNVALFWQIILLQGVLLLINYGNLRLVDNTCCTCAACQLFQMEETFSFFCCSRVGIVWRSHHVDEWGIIGVRNRTKIGWYGPEMVQTALEKIPERRSCTWWKSSYHYPKNRRGAWGRENPASYRDISQRASRVCAWTRFKYWSSVKMSGRISKILKARFLGSWILVWAQVSLANEEF